MIGFWLTNDPWHLVGIIVGLAVSFTSLIMMREAVMFNDRKEVWVALTVFGVGGLIVLTGWYLPILLAGGIIVLFIITAARTLWSGIKLLLDSKGKSKGENNDSRYAGQA